MREYYLVMQEIALLVKAHGLAAVPEPGVDGQCPFLAERRREKQLLKVVSEHLNRLHIRLLFGFLEYLVGDRRVQKALESILDRLAYLLGK